MPIQTRAVLAAAYRGKGLEKATLTHSVTVDADGYPVRVLCGSVKIDHIADECAQDTAAAPTCVKCAGRFAKLGCK